MSVLKFKTVLALFCCAAMLAAACSGSDDPDSTADTSGATTTAPEADPTTTEAAEVAIETVADTDLEVRPGVEQVTVTGAERSDALTLVDDEGDDMLTLLADDLGQAHFAYIPDEPLTADTAEQGSLPTAEGFSLKAGTYTVRRVAADAAETDPASVTEPFDVLGVDDGVGDDAFYTQDLAEQCPDIEATRSCYTYITMRDGVTLSAMIRLPLALLYPEGPYPTVIEYSGYGPSRPVGDGEPGSRIAGLFGFASVGVNMRGSGCSGGVFDVFNPAQQADGYDIIEAVATEPWVLHNSPGMVGLSYAGIGQLVAASQAPPSLASIAPQSVIEDPWRQAWPGGIFNSGFTKQWIAQREAQSAPGGTDWVTELIDGGDSVCETNLEVRDQGVEFESFTKALEFYLEDSDDRRFSYLVDDIDVPVFLTGGWQDEQTGPRFGTMLDRFTSSPMRKFNVFNGHHPDGYSPALLSRWFEFLEFTVSKRIPVLNPLVRDLAPAELEKEFGVALELEEDRFADFATYDEAYEAYAAEDPIRVLYEFGTGVEGVPGGQLPSFIETYSEWPVPEAEPFTLFLGDDEQLLASAPDEEGADAYDHDPEAGETAYFDDEGSNSEFQQPLIEFDWEPLAEGLGASYVSEPFAEDTILAGPGYAELYFTPGADDPVIEVNLAEIYPDGTEVRIQSGWLRAAHQGIDDELSDEFRVERTYSEEDFELLTPGEQVAIKVAINPFAHPVRAGSRLRLTVETPGRNTPLWKFENPTYDGTVTHEVGYGGAQASSLVLQELPALDIPDAYPPCPSLRGQVCHPFVPIVNTDG